MMSEIESKTGIPFLDEISWIAIAYLLVGTLVIYIAWRSTFVRHDNRINIYRQRTVFIFNPQTGDFQQHSVGLSLNDLSAHLQAPPPTLESILDEVNGITSGATYHTQQQDDNLDVDLMEDETQEIIRDMDRDIDRDREQNDTEFGDGLRHRRLNVSLETDASSEMPTAVITSATTTSSTSTNLIRRLSQGTNSGTVDDVLHINPVIDRSPSTSTNPTNNIDETDEVYASSNPIECIAQASNTIETNATYGDEITIKLKYLNDDLKIVRARPNEAIGDFKKRNFSEELSAQKLVRLVFNGHVLQPDSKTITACGLFDNCVVHCLIHNPRPNAVPPPNQPIDNNQPIPPINEEGNEQIGIENLINANRNRNRNTQRLLNLSLFLICLSVIISWFFRIQYFQLFTWYSTVGLVLLTTFFLVIIPLIFLIEREIFRNL